MHDEQIADALVLVMTAGMSLEQWDSLGVLPREWALYERLGGRYQRIVIVSYGGARDRELARSLAGSSIAVVANDCGLEDASYRGSIPSSVAQLLDGCASVVVKTNQMIDAGVAAAVTGHLRSCGKAVGLVARGGYLASRFEAAEHGTGSPRAAQVARDEGELCQSADVVLGTTPSMVEDLAWRYGLEGDRCVVIPNYVHVPELEEESVPRDAGVVLYAGQLVPRKGVDILIRAMSELDEPYKSRARLEVIGDGPERRRLADLAESLGVRASFEPRIPQPELQQRMARCAVYAQASSLEGHPKTVIEAMAMGAPVVVADSPGLEDVVEHGVTGLVCQRTSGALAHMIGGLMGDADWAGTLGENACAKARAWYGLDRVIQREVKAHRLALENGSHRSATAPPPVRWNPELLGAPLEAQVKAFADSLNGFARRLEPMDRARFCLALDAPLYWIQGQAAVEAAGGLHPKHRILKYHDFFTQRIEPGQRVLDLGSGNGALSASMARAGATVLGMDITPQHVELARQRAGDEDVGTTATFVLGDITKDRAEGQWDTIVLSNVLEHLRDRPALLRQWLGWYHPRRFLIRVPAFDREWRVPFKKEIGVEWRLDDTHETEYTLEQLESELGEAGLRITDRVQRWGELWVSAEPEGVQEHDRAAA